MIRALCFALLILYPLAWAAPLLRASPLPLFGLTEISVLSGLRSLWQTDFMLALVVTLFALVAPYLKTVGLLLVQSDLLPTRALTPLNLLSKLAMADVFLIAIYIILAKGQGVGRIETGWGLYLFTACILLSIWIGWKTQTRRPT